MNNIGHASRIRFRFEKLEVWQEARRLNLEIYRLARRLPADEDYGLISQVRRASVSISANIAEGSVRNSDRDFAHFLEQAYGSAMELASHLFLAGDLGYLEVKLIDSCLQQIDRLAIRLAALNRSLAVKISKVKL
jgi:four helix bundle protein